MEVLKHPQHKPSTDLCTVPAEIHPVGALTGEPIPTDPHSLLCQLHTFDLQPLIINQLFIDQVGGHKIPQIVTQVDNNTLPVVSRLLYLWIRQLHPAHHLSVHLTHNCIFLNV